MKKTQKIILLVTVFLIIGIVVWMAFLKKPVASNNVLTPTATATPEPAATATPEPTATSTPTPTPTNTPTPEPTATPTPSPTNTPTPTPTPTNTPTPTPTFTPTPEPTATPTPTPTNTPTPEPTATPVPTEAPKADDAGADDTSKANPDAWNQVVENLINTGKADKEEDYYSLGLEVKEKPQQYMMLWDGSKDNGSKTSELKEGYVGIDSMHKESLGEQCKNQYGFVVSDMSEKSNSTSAPNMTMGIINTETGEFIFTTVCNDKYYRVLSYDKEQFGKGLEFSNGDGCMVTSGYWSEVGKYAIRMTNKDTPWMAWINDFQIRFDDAINTEDYMFFATTCDMDTWLENEDWYYYNSYTVVQDFYGNFDRFYTEGAGIEFWTIKNDSDFQ